MIGSPGENTLSNQKQGCTFVQLLAECLLRYGLDVVSKSI